MQEEGRGRYAAARTGVGAVTVQLELSSENASTPAAPALVSAVSYSGSIADAIADDLAGGGKLVSNCIVQTVSSENETSVGATESPLVRTTFSLRRVFPTGGGTCEEPGIFGVVNTC